MNIQLFTTRKKLKLQKFINFCKDLSELSVSQSLKVAALAFKIDFTKIGSMGYNGSYSSATINEHTNGEEDSLIPGESGMVHAEMNLVAKFHELDINNYIVILTHSPCEICSKLLLNAGFKYIYWEHEYRKTDHLSILPKFSGNFEKLYNDYPQILESFYERNS